MSHDYTYSLTIQPHLTTLSVHRHLLQLQQHPLRRPSYRQQPLPRPQSTSQEPRLRPDWRWSAAYLSSGEPVVGTERDEMDHELPHWSAAQMSVWRRLRLLMLALLLRMRTWRSHLQRALVRTVWYVNTALMKASTCLIQIYSSWTSWSLNPSSKRPATTSPAQQSSSGECPSIMIESSWVC